jgi:hypothetical protein
VRFRVLLVSQDGDPVDGYWTLNTTELPNIGAVVYVTEIGNGGRTVRARVGKIELDQSLPIVATQTDEE